MQAAAQGCGLWGCVPVRICLVVMRQDGTVDCNGTGSGPLAALCQRRKEGGARIDRWWQGRRDGVSKRPPMGGSDDGGAGSTKG